MSEATMHAVEIVRFGGPDALTWREVADLPAPGAGEVLLEVVAAGVNRADVVQRQGHYAPPPGASDVPGLECSGRVRTIGAGVEGWQVGDEVCALLSGGGYAEAVVVPAGQLLPVPKGVDLVSAAALPEVACTVWSNVVDVAGLRAGEWLLVHGGSSGIGTMAIQVARRVVGARVAVTAGSRAKLDACAALGAEVLVDYHTEEFVERVREATGDAGADVVLDIVGGDYLARNVEVLARGGRMVTIGLLGGRRGELDLSAVMTKRLSLHGTTLRSRPVREKAAIVAGAQAAIWPAIERGDVRPVVDRVLSIRDAPDAHRLLESSEHIGKIVLTTGA